MKQLTRLVRHAICGVVSVEDVRKSDGLTVTSFSNLLDEIAKLSFLNPDLHLLFRGQAVDHIVNCASSLLPPIYRGLMGDCDEIRKRFEERLGFLKDCSISVIQDLKNCAVENEHINRLSKHAEVSWAVLQHYQPASCRTPYLDVTQSLRVAASFALRADNCEVITEPSCFSSTGWLYVIGVPFLPVSRNSWYPEELTVLRLASLLPEYTKRAVRQEAYMIGSYPLLSGNRCGEADVANRLVAKYKLVKKDFWDVDVQCSDKLLFPEAERDGLCCVVDGAVDYVENERGGCPS